METLIQRFAAICEKYYEAAAKSGGVQQGDFFMFGESFTNYSGTIGTVELCVLLPSVGVTLRKICIREGRLIIPTDLSTHEVKAAVTALEVHFDAVIEGWKRGSEKRKAESIARLEKLQAATDAELKRLRG
jgi:hypothetical protein